MADFNNTHITPGMRSRIESLIRRAESIIQELDDILTEQEKRQIENDRLSDEIDVLDFDTFNKAVDDYKIFSAVHSHAFVEDLTDARYSAYSLKVKLQQSLNT